VEAYVSFDFIWFDIGNTLLHRERERLFAELLEKAAVKTSAADIELAFHITDKRFMREFPGLLGKPAEEFMPLYFGLLCRYLNIGGNILSLLNAWFEARRKAELAWMPYPAVPDLLERLAAGGKRLGIISNWDPGATSILATLGILDYFEAVIISSEVGVSKPDERIFRIALEKVSIDPARCLYVGDNYYDDAVGAATVGMESLIINRHGLLGVEELPGLRFISDVSDVLSYLGVSHEDTSCPSVKSGRPDAGDYKE